MNDRVHPARWVTPNLLDAIAYPELVYVLTLANLMSPRLWEIVDRIREEARMGERSAETLAAHYVDRHFEHVPPARLFELYGPLDLEQQARRVGQDVVRYAIEHIAEDFTFRKARGLSPGTLDVPRFQRGELPAFSYNTIDEAHACRRLLGHRSRKPQGLTCCIDEAALYAALVLAMPEYAAADLFFLIEPGHCTVMHETAHGTVWYYSKQLQFDERSWTEFVRESYGGDVQQAFSDKLYNCDLIATDRGVLTVGASKTTLEPGRHDAVIDRVTRFIGAEVRQLARLRKHGREQYQAEIAQPGALFFALDGTISARDVANRLRRCAFDDRDPIALNVLYTFRSLDVPEPSIYLDAAHLSGLTAHFVPLPSSVDDCLAIVRSCEGTQSIFDDRNRIALPDETMRYRTGTDRDKGLLLQLLLERIQGQHASMARGWQTIMEDRRTIVAGPGGCFDASSLELSQPSQSRPVAVISSSSGQDGGSA